MKQYGQKITVIGRKAKYCEWEEFIFRFDRAEGSPYRSTYVSFCVGGIFLNKIHHYAANAQWSGLYKRAAKIILVEKLELLDYRLLNILQFLFKIVSLYTNLDY